MRGGQSLHRPQLATPARGSQDRRSSGGKPIRSAGRSAAEHRKRRGRTGPEPAESRHRQQRAIRPAGAGSSPSRGCASVPPSADDRAGAVHDAAWSDAALMHQPQRRRRVSRSRGCRDHRSEPSAVSVHDGGASGGPGAAGHRGAAGATGRMRAHHEAAYRNHDASIPTGPGALSLHLIRLAGESPGQCRRAAAMRHRGVIMPHAAPLVARVHANCRMMHQLQFCSLSMW